MARDLGAAVGAGATLASLQRTKSSGFILKESLSLEAITQQVEDKSFTPLSPEVGLQALPEVALNANAVIYWCQGRKPLLEVPYLSLAADNIVRVVGRERTFLGVGEIQADTSVTVLSHRVVYAQPQ
ncbi:MAG: tRNA pseudouridine(55) synthase TruB [Cyanobacteria bacterium J06554_6]